MGLNAYQHNALETRMRHLEHTLIQIRRLLRLPLDGHLTPVRGLSPEVNLQADAALEAMLEEVAELAVAFDLEPETEDVGQLVRGEMTIAWADLNDTLSAKLRGYGPVDASLETTLDPHLRHLIALSDHLVQLVKGGA